MIRLSTHHVLSTAGSDRATSYDCANKVVTLGSKTHVVWTDAVARTRGCTFDHAAGVWGETLTIGEGCDNHNNPCLTADRDGYLHVIYGPHGRWDQVHRTADWPSGQFHYAVSTEPNSLVGMDRVSPPRGAGGPFGYCATYASMLNLAGGPDALVYRGGEYPSMVLFQKQRAGGGWTFPKPLFRQDVAPQYTHYAARLVAAPDGTLYAGASFFCASRYSLGTAVLASADGGETWTDLRGQRADTPVEYAPRFAVPHPDPRFDPRLSGLGVDSRGQVWAYTHEFRAGAFQALLSRWDGTGWSTVDVSQFLPPDRGAGAGTLCVDSAGRVHLFLGAVDRARVTEGENTFAHPSTEVFHLCSADGMAPFECRAVSDPDPGIASWQPSISTPGPHHPVHSPVLLYTHGNNLPAGPDGKRPVPSTEVRCVFVEE